MQGFGCAQSLRQLFELVDDGESGSDIAAGDHVVRIRVGDDVAVGIDNVHGAVAHAGILEAGEQRQVETTAANMPANWPSERKRNGDHECGAIVFSEGEGSLTKWRPCMLAVKARLSAPPDEGIRVGGETAGGLSLGLFIDGGGVQDTGIIFDEALQQARELRSVGGIVHVLNPSGERQDLALALQLLAEIFSNCRVSLASERVISDCWTRSVSCSFSSLRRRTWRW